MEERRHRGQHEDCFACRALSVGISPSAMPTRRNSNPSRQLVDANSWEKGVATHPSGLPYLDAQGETIGLHQWQGQRHGYERELAAATTYGAEHGHMLGSTPKEP